MPGERAQGPVQRVTSNVSLAGQDAQRDGLALAGAQTVPGPLVASLSHLGVGVGCGGDSLHTDLGLCPRSARSHLTIHPAVSVGGELVTAQSIEGGYAA